MCGLNDLPSIIRVQALDSSPLIDVPQAQTSVHRERAKNPESDVPDEDQPIPFVPSQIHPYQVRN